MPLDDQSSVECTELGGLRYCKYTNLYYIDGQWMYVGSSPLEGAARRAGKLLGRAGG